MWFRVSEKEAGVWEREGGERERSTYQLFYGVLEDTLSQAEDTPLRENKR